MSDPTCDSPVCSSILCPACRVGVTISTIVSFTRVGSLKNSHGAYCVEADPSFTVLVKASSLINVGSQGRAAVHTGAVWSTITGLHHVPLAFNETVQKGSPWKLNTTVAMTCHRRRDCFTSPRQGMDQQLDQPLLVATITRATTEQSKQLSPPHRTQE
jgi:hypothetical protein